ncbi:hypothetical protein [Marinomonas sp. 2405UD68-3]
MCAFQQAFNQFTLAGSGGDAGLIQDSTWKALYRGVACQGDSTPQLP